MGTVTIRKCFKVWKRFLELRDITFLDAKKLYQTHGYIAIANGSRKVYLIFDEFHMICILGHKKESWLIDPLGPMNPDLKKCGLFIAQKEKWVLKNNKNIVLQDFFSSACCYICNFITYLYVIKKYKMCRIFYFLKHKRSYCLKYLCRKYLNI